MLKKFSWMALIITLIATLAVGVTGMAQDDDGAAAASEEATDGSSINWDEAIFVLMALAIVMGGLVGFEYIQRRRHTLP